MNASDVSTYLKPISASALSGKLKNMKNGPSGSDFVTVKTFKYIYPVFCGHLVYLINECFRTGVFPSCLKIAKVITLY